MLEPLDSTSNTDVISASMSSGRGHPSESPYHNVFNCKSITTSAQWLPNKRLFAIKVTRVSWSNLTLTAEQASLISLVLMAFSRTSRPPVAFCSGLQTPQYTWSLLGHFLLTKKNTCCITSSLIHLCKQGLTIAEP